jgi:hypothetical protein
MDNGGPVSGASGVRERGRSRADRFEFGLGPGHTHAAIGRVALALDLHPQERDCTLLSVVRGLWSVVGLTVPRTMVDMARSLLPGRPQPPCLAKLTLDHGPSTGSCMIGRKLLMRCAARFLDGSAEANRRPLQPGYDIEFVITTRSRSFGNEIA